MKKRDRFQLKFPNEFEFIKQLKSPWAIQDFLDTLPYNLKGDTFYSPSKVLEHKTADCFEGAIFSAASLFIQGHKPLIVDLVADPRKDDDHLLAVYKIHGLWGAIAKSKFTGLKFRDPVFKNIRELVMSYFDDYINEVGEKTLVKYSKKPLNLMVFGERWLTSERVDFVANYLIRREQTGSYERVVPMNKKIHYRNADPLLLRAAMLGYPK